MKAIILALALLLLAAPVRAAEFPMEPLFEEPCRNLAIPEPLARAIATIESGLNPWAVNIAGKSFYHESKSAALAQVREAWPTGRSIDVGLMQVNRWWLERFDIDLEAALDPVANIYLGGWILKQELERHGSVRAAVGAYHSPDQARAARYADQVMRALEAGPNNKPRQTVKPAPASSLPPAPMLITNENQSMKVKHEKTD